MTLPRVKHIVANSEGRLERGFSWVFFHLSLRSDQSHGTRYASRAGYVADKRSRFKLLQTLYALNEQRARRHSIFESRTKMSQGGHVLTHKIICTINIQRLCLAVGSRHGIWHDVLQSHDMA